MASFEERRLQALYERHILDTPKDGVFDSIVRLAAELFGVPIALVTLVDRDRIWFKSSYGLDAAEIPREDGLCASAVYSSDIYEVADAARDERTVNNSLVAGNFALRFYASQPLVTGDGYGLGNLCVIDKVSRSLTEKEKFILKSLGDIVLSQIELRLSARIVVNYQKKAASIICDEVQEVLGTIPLTHELMEAHRDDVATFRVLRSQVEESIESVASSIRNFSHQIERVPLQDEFDFERVDLGTVLLGSMHDCMWDANLKNIDVDISIGESVAVAGNSRRLRVMCMELLEYAYRHSREHSPVSISLEPHHESVILSVASTDADLCDDTLSKVCSRFAPDEPHTDPRTHGLGLWSVQEIVEFHRGSFSVQRKGSQGVEYTIQMPRRAH
jgi:signal transduction histidine kinase